jgi:hypothetical protein
MLDTINQAYGSSISDANNSAGYTQASFAKVQDVVGVFGQIIEQFVNESTNNMDSARSESKIIGNLVGSRLDELDERVNDQIRWLEGGANSTKDSQTTGLQSIRAMQESEKQSVADVDKSLKAMDGDIESSVNSIAASLAEAQTSSSEWASSVMQKVNDWETTERRKFANRLIARKSSFLEKRK